MSPDGNNYNHIHHLLIDRRQIDVRSFRAVHCDTDHCLMVAKVRERISVNKQRSHIFHMERFILKKLNEVEGKKQYCVEVSNKFAALEDLDAEVNINRAWETIREYIKISANESLGYFELKKHKPWFDYGFSANFGSPCHSFHQLLHTGTTCQVVADIPSGLFTPPQALLQELYVAEHYSRDPQ
jgi:hypothetical protein